MATSLKLGILAGGGTLPARLAAACRGQGRACFVLAIEGQTDPASVAQSEHAWVPFGAAAKALKLLRQAEVKELAFAGPVQRPSLSRLRPDWRAAAFLTKVSIGSLGDNSLLTAIANEFEREGFTVIGIDQVLHGILAPPGPLGAHSPDAGALADIARAIPVVQALGRADRGQAAVVRHGAVLGVEDSAGTDALLARVAGLRRAGPGGVLVKLCKPHQDRRLDLPTIGVTTVAGAAGAGLEGLAVEAGGTLIIDREAVVRAADAAGLFLLGLAVAP